MGSGTLIILIVVVFALMYFMVMRPQKKQMDKQREMLNRMEEGTRVMLTSGVFGTVRATGETQAVIELAPGVDITVLKQAISKIVRPEDEEFEFADGEPVDGDAAESDEAVVAQSDESAELEEAQSEESAEADGAGSGEPAAQFESDDAEHEDGAAVEAAAAQQAATGDAENDQN